MSIGPTHGPVQRAGADRDIRELFQRVEDLERAKRASGAARMVYGSVLNDAGVDNAGTADWTADWTDHLAAAGPASNYYTINFATPFDRVPDVVLTANNDNAPGEKGRYTVSLLHEPTVGYFEVLTTDNDDADAVAQDGGFEFIAIEPPA